MLCFLVCFPNVFSFDKKKKRPLLHNKNKKEARTKEMLHSSFKRNTRIIKVRSTLLERESKMAFHLKKRSRKDDQLLHSFPNRQATISICVCICSMYNTLFNE
jgi:hypothetical protein